VSKSKYYVAAISAFVVWGLFSFALKPIAAYPSIDILFYRVFFAAAILLIYAYGFNRRKMKLNFHRFSELNPIEKKQTVLLTLFGGLLLTANWFVFIYVTNHISIKSAAYAYMICPILATLLGYFILNEKLMKHQWISILISIASIFLLLLNNVTDVMYSLIVAVSYALYLISQRKNNLIDKLPILTYQMVFSYIILLFFYPNYSAPLPTES